MKRDERLLREIDKACAELVNDPAKFMAKKRTTKFEYGQSDNGQWYWRVRAGNGEIIASGEGYKRKAGVINLYKTLFGIPPEMVYLDEGFTKRPKPKKARKPKWGKCNRQWP